MTALDLWNRHRQHLSRVAAIGLTLDVSRMRFDDGFLERMAPAMQRRSRPWTRWKRGAIANPDEKRMVGHYWLRAPDLAPTPEIAAEIRKTIGRHQGVRRRRASRLDPSAHGATIHRACSPSASAARRWARCLWPMPLGDPAADRMRVDFIDNTDPDGIARTLQRLAGRLGETLCLVTSKSGGTPETRNGMLLVAEAYEAAGLEFPRHAVAITMPGSTDGPDGIGRGLAGSLPDVRLGRRPDQRTFRRRPAAGGAARAGYRRLARRRGGLRRGHATARRCDAIPPP